MTNDAQGNAYPSGKSTTGYLQSICSDAGNIVLGLFLPYDYNGNPSGEWRKLSDITTSITTGNASCSVSMSPTNAAPGEFLAYGSDGYVRKWEFTDHQYKTWSDNWSGGTSYNPALTSSVVGSTTIPAALKAYGVDTTYWTGWQMTGVKYPVVAFFAWVNQGSIGMTCFVDVTTDTVINCIGSGSPAPEGWGGYHGSQGWGYMGPSSHYVQNNPTVLDSPGVAGEERWDMFITSIANNGGSTALAAKFVDTVNGCTGANSTWLALAQSWGSSGCITVNFQYNTPVAQNASSRDVQPYGSIAVGDRPGPWPHNSASCNGDGTTTNCWSQLRPIGLGDELVDPADSHGMGYADQFMVVGLNGTTAILARGMNPFPNGQNVCTYPMQAHASGFILSMVPTGLCSAGLNYYDYTNPYGSTIYYDNNLVVYGGHSVSVGGSLVAPYGGSGLPCGNLTGYAARDQSSFPAYVGNNPGIYNDMVYSFEGNCTGSDTSYVQSHPGANYTGNNHIFDGRPIGGGGGGAQYLSSNTLTKVTSTGQKFLYTISTPQGALNPKLKQALVWAGYYTLPDRSGPNCTIDDNHPGFAYVVIANECVSGSTAGTVYVDLPGLNNAGQCYVNTPNLLAPCVYVGNSAWSAYVEQDMHRDVLGLHHRVLTNGFNGPGRTINYANMKGDGSAGTYSFFQVSYPQGQRTDFWAALLPPWIPDSVNRTQHINVPVQIPPQPSGTTARVVFGYNPNLYCTSRQDTCTTGTSLSSGTFVTSLSFPGSHTRNDSTRWAGMNITVGAYPLTVTALGRYCLSGNSQTHQLTITTGPNNTPVLGSVNVNMSGCTPGTTVYGSLSPFVTLSANTQYYITSSEVSGGDTFWDTDSVLTTTTNAATLTGGVWCSAVSGGSCLYYGTQNSTYGPLNFQYTVAQTGIFSFGAENQTWAATSTTNPTTVNVPAFANSVLYYQIQTQQNGIITSWPMDITAVQ